MTAPESAVIIDRDETVLLDRGRWGLSNILHRYWISEDREEQLDWSGGGHLEPARDGVHLLLHERRSESQIFTIRPIRELDRIRASAVHDGERWDFQGSVDLFRLVEPYQQAWSEQAKRTVFLHLDPEDPEPDPLSWFDEDAYDTAYQGPLNAYQVPGSDAIIIAVQRDSRPVLYHPQSRRVLGYLNLADRHGNPALYFRRHAEELWADDYDTLLRIRPGTWEVLDSRRLQGAKDGMMQNFIGSFWFPPEEDVCVVPRPFSGDVVFLDPVSFDVVEIVETGSQPLDAVVLSDGTVLARDWKTRRLIRGESALRSKGS